MADSFTRPEDIPSNPYYVHPSENPSLLLVTNLLTEGNYHSWCRAMKKALISKNKLKFIDGSIAVPCRNDPSFPAWERCNNMVCSWLTRAVSNSISESLSCIDNAIDVWEDLRERFSQIDAIRISDLQEEIYSFKQNNMTVTDYFTQLKMLWDELGSLRPIPNCVCNPACSCMLLRTVKDYFSNDKVIRFVKGLNDNFGILKTQIMMMEPLPPINKAFSMIIQHERQLGSGSNTAESNIFYSKSHANYSPDGNQEVPDHYNPASTSAESSVFYNKGAPAYLSNGPKPRNFGFNQNKKPICSHCGKEGHTVDICYRKHGFPPNFQFKNKRNAPVYANQVECSNASDNCSKAESADFNDNAQQFFTQEQYSKILALINQNGSTAHVNTISTHFKPEESPGNITPLCFSTRGCQSTEWIIDTDFTFERYSVLLIVLVRF
ncbi:uncharacterized protein LOC126668770 [Mercurialis annua]|uniref:uncharacterized protein LOC126668770 n=1 Tax=Mercurialis annua TaxID=3986 RepID=UPI00215EA444|nr:uncharacterized protein LOC126668770 [Mercurialis annua]